MIAKENHHLEFDRGKLTLEFIGGCLNPVQDLAVNQVVRKDIAGSNPAPPAFVL
jgi:hypothetical protein